MGSCDLTYLDLFAGAGGLSGGFARAGFRGIAHVEMDTAACFTLRTRQAYRYLLGINGSDAYHDYLHNRMSRQELYDAIPKRELDRVLNHEMSAETFEDILAGGWQRTSEAV